VAAPRPGLEPAPAAQPVSAPAPINRSFPSTAGGVLTTAATVTESLLLVASVAAALERLPIPANDGPPTIIFDGWIRVEPDHLVHVIYGSYRERSIPFSRLRATDIAGMRHAYVRSREGTVTKLASASAAPRP
jgi:hypothetical protein